MRRVIIMGALLGLGACTQGEPDLLNFRASAEGPDEFSVLPTRPLVLDGLAQSVSTLPPPTPGGANLTDPTPQADAYAALGGSAAAAARSADGGIVNYAARGGINPNIRAELAADDLRYRQRRRGRVLERLFRVNTYFDAYERQSLDQYQTLDQIRDAGVGNPAAPPFGFEVEQPPSGVDGPSFYDPSPAISGG